MFLVHTVHQLSAPKTYIRLRVLQIKPFHQIRSVQIAGSFTCNDIVFHYLSKLYSLHTRETTILKVNVKAGLPKSFDLLIISRIKIVRYYRYVTIIHDPVVRTTVIPFIIEKIAYHHVEFLS